MTLRLWHADSQSSSSTLVTRDAIVKIYSEVFGQDIFDVSTKQWRKTFQKFFYELTRAEFTSADNMQKIAAIGLAELHASVIDESGRCVSDVIKSGWDTKTDLVVTFEIRGTHSAKPVSISDSQVASWVSDHLAEPAVADFMTSSMMPPAGHILFALGAGAECAPTSPWLNAGGEIAAVMRAGASRWAGLISDARSSAGVLYVPVLSSKLVGVKQPLSDSQLAELAGLDLIEDTAEISNWMKHISTRCNKVIIGAFSYSPGASHIMVQAAQDALMAQAVDALNHDSLVLTWLGTPTDSIAVDLSIHEDRLERFNSRSNSERLRDLLWRALGGLKAPHTDLIITSYGKSLALIDCSVALQGANYLFSKRSQRWRAYLADSQGVQVAYVVTPPARTSSVLRHRILRASYQGARHFGFRPFDVQITQTLSAALLIGHLNHVTHSDPFDPAQLSVSRAVHGGLWRTIYEPSSVWMPATIRGWVGIFRSENGAKS